MTKTVRARYTLEFKQEAVRLVTGGHSIAAALATGSARVSDPPKPRPTTARAGLAPEAAF